MNATTRQHDERRAQRWKPPPKPSPFIDFCRTMRLPEGPAKGELWDPATEPAQRLWIEAVMSGIWRRFCLICPSQRGKTQMLTALWFWVIVQLRTSVALIMPNGEKLDQNWETKFKPTIEGSGLGNLLPVKGRGSKGGRGGAITLRDPNTGIVLGRTVFMALGGGSKETSTSSATVGLAALDEGDDAESAGQLALVWKRIEAMGSAGMAIVASTVNYRALRDEHPILQIHESGTQSRIFHRCPHCTQHSALDLECLDTIKECIVCPRCAVVWSEADRHDALNNALLIHTGQQVINGTVVGEPVKSPIFSLLTVGIDYHWEIPDRRTGKVELLIPKICADYRAAKEAEAKGDISLMRTHMNKVWCRKYIRTDGDRVDLVESVLRDVAAQSDYQRGELSPSVHGVVLPVDVQLRRHYWLAIGYNADGSEIFILDWGRDAICGDMEQPTKEQRHEGLERIDKMARNGFSRDDRVLPCALVGVDTGFRPEEIRPWIAKEGRRARWIAMRGAGDEMFTRMKSSPAGTSKKRDEGYYDLREQDDSPDGRQMFVDNDPALDRIAAAWRTGKLHLPRDIDNEIIAHLTGMRPCEPGAKGPRWIPRGKRHDFLDDLVYGQAMVRYLITRPKPPARKYGAIGDVA